MVLLLLLEVIFSCDKYTWVARIDQDGKMIWQKALGFLNTQSNGQSITNTFDGGFIVCGSVIDVNKTSTRIIKFNHDNKIEWERTFDIGIPLSITQTKDKGFAICGYIPYGNNSTQGFISIF